MSEKIIPCRDCGQIMTNEEISYYEYRCEQCEREYLDRVETWRHGEEDKVLDNLYGNPETIH